jgi:hypothetical protein
MVIRIRASPNASRKNWDGKVGYGLIISSIVPNSQKHSQYKTVSSNALSAPPTIRFRAKNSKNPTAANIPAQIST